MHHEQDRACGDESYVQSLLEKNAMLDKRHDDVTAMGGLRGAARRAWRAARPYLPFLNGEREELEDKLEFCCECRA